MRVFTLEQRAAENQARVASGVCVAPAEVLRRAPDAPRTESRRALLATHDRLAAAERRAAPLAPREAE